LLCWRLSCFIGGSVSLLLLGLSKTVAVSIIHVSRMVLISQCPTTLAPTTTVSISMQMVANTTTTVPPSPLHYCGTLVPLWNLWQPLAP
jgi:hypothetical protein